MSSTCTGAERTFRSREVIYDWNPYEASSALQSIKCCMIRADDCVFSLSSGRVTSAREYGERENKQRRMKFMLQRNNMRMLQIYTSWAQEQLPGRVSDIRTDLSNLDILDELVYLTTGTRPRSKKDETSEDHVHAVLKQLAERGCDLVECSPNGILDGDLDAVLTFCYTLSRFKEEKENAQPSTEQQPRDTRSEQVITKIKPPQIPTSRKSLTMSRLPKRNVPGAAKNTPDRAAASESKIVNPKCGFGFQRPSKTPTTPSEPEMREKLEKKPPRPRSASNSSRTSSIASNNASTTRTARKSAIGGNKNAISSGPSKLAKRELAKTSTRPKTAPAPPQRTTSKLSVEPADPSPPKLPEKQTPAKSQGLASGTSQLKKPTSLPLKSTRVKKETKEKMTASTRMSAESSSMSSSRIKPPTFKTGIKSPTAKAASEVPHGTRLPYVSASKSESRIAPAAPAPASTSSQQIVRRLSQTGSTKPANFKKPKQLKESQNDEPAVKQTAPPPLPQRSTSTSEKSPEPPTKSLPMSPRNAPKGDGKSKIASTFSKLSQMSPKFGRKQMKVAKTQLDIKSKNPAVPQKEPKQAGSERRSIGNLFSPKVPKKLSSQFTSSSPEIKGNIPENNQSGDPQVNPELIDIESPSSEVPPELPPKNSNSLDETTNRARPKSLIIAQKERKPSSSSSIASNMARNPSMSSKISIIDLVGDEIVVDEEIDLNFSAKKRTKEMIEEGSDRPDTSASSCLSDTKSFIKESSIKNGDNNEYLDDDEDDDCFKSATSPTASDTASQISLMVESIQSNIARTKSYEALKDAQSFTRSPRARPRPRPNSLFCSYTTPRISESGEMDLEDVQVDDPALDAVRRAMERSDLLQRLERWDPDDFSSPDEEVLTDEISCSSSSTSPRSPTGDPEMERKRLGSSKVAARLAKTKSLSIHEENIAIQAENSSDSSCSNLPRPSNSILREKKSPLRRLISTPPESVHSDTTYERKSLLPNRSQQRRSFHAKRDFNSLRKTESHNPTISPSVRYPYYQSMPRNYGRSFSSQNLKGENDAALYKGSRVSLYSNPEDREEIFRLRNYLESYESKISQLQEQINSKERQLKQNQTVCAAFEQQLQKFRITSPESKSGEDKRDSITEATPVEASEAKKEEPVSSPVMEKVVPAESMTSISSHASNSSSNSFDELRKRNSDRKNWSSKRPASMVDEPITSTSFESSLGRKTSMRRQLRDSFRTAFGKNRSSKYPSASRSSCGEVLGIIDDDESINTSETSESVDEMKNIIKEKDQKLKESDRRLTDVRLAALSYQHERDQLLDELQALREERDLIKNSNGSICHRSSFANGTLSSIKNLSSDNDEKKVPVYLETFSVEKRMIGHLSAEDAEDIEAEIHVVFEEYLKQLDEKSFGLTAQSIIKTEMNNGSACVRVSFAAAIALNEAIHLTKASQIFDAAIESRRVLISGTAADSKKDLARRIAQILACQELSVESAKDIPHHAIKTAGIVKDIEALQALFEPVSDEPEAEQDRPIILIVDIALVEQRDLIKTLRSRGKTPIVVAIGKENEVSAECAEIFHVVQMVCGGADLAMKLRMKYANHVVMHGPVKARRSVNNQIKFLENLHEKINTMLITYKNSQAKIGSAWYETCPWNASEFQNWFVRLWNTRLRPYLIAAIIEGVKEYGDKGQDWFDIVNWIKNNFEWKNDFVFDQLSAADCGLRRIDGDPLLLMLQRLEFASKMTLEVEPNEYSLPAPIY